MKKWWGYFCSRSKLKDSLLKEILESKMNFYKLNYPFLEPPQILGKSYSSLGIPHYCGNINKKELRELVRKEGGGNVRSGLNLKRIQPKSVRSSSPQHLSFLSGGSPAREEAGAGRRRWREAEAGPVWEWAAPAPRRPPHVYTRRRDERLQASPWSSEGRAPPWQPRGGEVSPREGGHDSTDIIVSDSPVQEGSEGSSVGGNSFEGGFGFSDSEESRDGAVDDLIANIEDDLDGAEATPPRSEVPVERSAAPGEEKPEGSEEEKAVVSETPEEEGSPASPKVEDLTATRSLPAAVASSLLEEHLEGLALEEREACSEASLLLSKVDVTEEKFRPGLSGEEGQRFLLEIPQSAESEEAEDVLLKTESLEAVKEESGGGGEELSIKSETEEEVKREPQADGETLGRRARDEIDSTDGLLISSEESAGEESDTEGILESTQEVAESTCSNTGRQSDGTSRPTARYSSNFKPIKSGELREENSVDCLEDTGDYETVEEAEGTEPPPAPGRSSVGLVRESEEEGVTPGESREKSGGTLRYSLSATVGGTSPELLKSSQTTSPVGERRSSAIHWRAGVPAAGSPPAPAPTRKSQSTVLMGPMEKHERSPGSEREDSVCPARPLQGRVALSRGGGGRRFPDTFGEPVTAEMFRRVKREAPGGEGKENEVPAVPHKWLPNSFSEPPRAETRAPPCLSSFSEPLGGGEAAPARSWLGMNLPALRPPLSRRPGPGLVIDSARGVEYSLASLLRRRRALDPFGGSAGRGEEEEEEGRPPTKRLPRTPDRKPSLSLKKKKRRESTTRWPETTRQLSDETLILQRRATIMDMTFGDGADKSDSQNKEI